MIRRATPAEAAAVTALVQRAYAQWVAVIGRRPAPMDDDYSARCEAGEVFCLMQGDALAGMIVLEDSSDHLWLDNVAVEPALSGQGIGRRLMDFAEAEARRRGLAEIQLLTHVMMQSNFVLYQRLGYVETERREENGFSRIYMAKTLSPA